MKKIATALILPVILLSACKKTPPVDPIAPAAPVAATAPAPAAPAAPTAEPTDAEREMAQKKAKLDYAMMEDGYLNDSKGQWATEAKASSTFNGVDIKRLLGKPDSEIWLNNNQEQGLDWIELGYATPVAATEVRLVIDEGRGVEAITKVELQSTDGKWNTVWNGISDVKHDNRGRRTWFVKTFEKTPYKVKAVKYTIANNLFNGYKEIDSAQLIGE